MLPLKNTVLFPFLLSPLLVNTERSKKVIDAVLVSPERLMLAVAVRGEVEGSPGADDVYRVGTVLRIVKMLKFPDESYRLVVQGVTRARVEEFVSEEPYLRARVRGARRQRATPARSRWPRCRATCATSSCALVAESPRLSDELQVLAQDLEDPSRLADLAASNLDLDVEARQRLLEEADVATRLRQVLAELRRSREALQVESEIREKVQTRHGQDAARLHAAPAARPDPPRARRGGGHRGRGRAAPRAHRSAPACPRRR